MLCLVVNCYKAYEDLDSATKKRMDGLRAVHRHKVPYMNELEPKPVIHPVVFLPPPSTVVCVCVCVCVCVWRGAM